MFDEYYMYICIVCTYSYLSYFVPGRIIISQSDGPLWPDLVLFHSSTYYMWMRLSSLFANTDHIGQIHDARRNSALCGSFQRLVRGLYLLLLSAAPPPHKIVIVSYNILLMFHTFLFYFPVSFWLPVMLKEMWRLAFDEYKNDYYGICFPFYSLVFQVLFVYVCSSHHRYFCFTLS